MEILLSAAATSGTASLPDTPVVEAGNCPGGPTESVPLAEDAPPSLLATEPDPLVAPALGAEDVTATETMGPAVTTSDAATVPPVPVTASAPAESDGPRSVESGTATPPTTEPVEPTPAAPGMPSTDSGPTSAAKQPADPAFPEAASYDWRSLVEPDLWQSVPDDVPELLRLLATSDLYVQDEVDVRLQPTVTRVWSHKGHQGQRLVQAPGRNEKFSAFVAADWRDGWVSVGYAMRRTADIFCLQLDHLVERSQQSGRTAMVLLDNAKIHTPQGSKLVEEALAKHGDKLRLVFIPTYDPEANPIERLWPPLRRAVTHNHRRSWMLDLYDDVRAYLDKLNPAKVLRHIGSPFANKQPDHPSTAIPTQT